MSLLKDYLLKEWFVMKPTKIKMVNGSTPSEVEKSSKGIYVKISDKTKV